MRLFHAVPPLKTLFCAKRIYQAPMRDLRLGYFSPRFEIENTRLKLDCWRTIYNETG
jgi:hypothetical protein